MEKLGYTTDDIKEGNIKDIEERIGKLGRNNISGLKLLAEELEVGLPTLKDIVEEVKKPGRDPRDEMPKPIFRRDVLKVEDLKVDMILTAHKKCCRLWCLCGYWGKAGWIGTHIPAK